jgi:serine/threonine protein kinase
LKSFEHGELADEPAARLEAHVKACVRCRELMTQFRATDPDTVLLRRVFESTGTRTVDCPAVAERIGAGASGAELPYAPAAQPGVTAAAARGHNGSWPIPDYERVLLCGEGSYGSVWAVRDRVGVHRAMKVIDLDRLEKARVHCHEMAALETYCRKIDRHPHLITVYHVGLADRLLYYTMELADDRSVPGLIRERLPANYRPLTLHTLIREGRLRADVAVEIVRRLLKGLNRLHSCGLLHRDIKPSNIIFVDRNPKLADIGILTADDRAGRSVGTPRYMPPDGATDKTCDIYALGRVLEESLFGFGAARGTYADLDSVSWDMNRVGEVVRRACAASSADRYASASAMLEDLEACRHLAGSLLDELGLRPPPAPRSAARIAQQLGLALIHRIPWIVAFLVAIYAIAKLSS